MIPALYAPPHSDKSELPLPIPLFRNGEGIGEGQIMAQAISVPRPDLSGFAARRAGRKGGMIKIRIMAQATPLVGLRLRL